MPEILLTDEARNRLRVFSMSLGSDEELISNYVVGRLAIDVAPWMGDGSIWKDHLCDNPVAIQILGEELARRKKR